MGGRTRPALQKGRVYVSDPDQTLAFDAATGGQMMNSPGRSDLAPLAEQAASGALQIDIDRVLPLEGARAGLDDIEAGLAHGKIVIDLSL